MGTGFRDFIRAFSVRWFVAMSGGLGVPLTAAGVFFELYVAKIVFFVTAVFCAVFSSFWIWKVEREARIKAEGAAKKLFAETLTLSLDPKQGIDESTETKAVRRLISVTVANPTAVIVTNRSYW